MACGGELGYIEVQLCSFLTLALDGGECWTVHPICCIAGERVLNTHKAECTLELLWMILERRNSFASPKNQTLTCLANSLLAVWIMALHGYMSRSLSMQQHTWLFYLIILYQMQKFRAVLELVHTDSAELMCNNSKYVWKVLWKQAWPINALQSTHAM
jgi:hypothetical protein